MKNNLDNIDGIERAASLSCSGGESTALCPIRRGSARPKFATLFVPSERTMNPREGPNQPTPA